MRSICFGGVSLPSTCTGSAENHEARRASSALHAIADRTARQPRRLFSTTAIVSTPNTTLSPFYFDLLREIGATIELRVVVDIVAGASAGGINGAMWHGH